MIDPRKSPPRLAMDEVLADGEWHPIEEVLSVGARAVPASRAVAKRRQDRDRWDSASTRSTDVEDEIRIGARAVAFGTIRTAVHAGTYERDGDMVRLRPGR